MRFLVGDDIAGRATRRQATQGVRPRLAQAATLHAGERASRDCGRRRGFNLTVKGNRQATAATGGVISSTAEVDKNALTTGTLTFSDIQNESHHDASSSGLSAGAGWGKTDEATGPGSVRGSGGVTPMISQNASGDESATTRSAIGAGTINITNHDGQTQDVATLNRDTTDTNGRVSETPDVQDLLSKQADTMQAAQAARQVVAQGIGAYADAKKQAAEKSGDKAGAESWAEGSTNRVLAHVAGGALIGGLGGGGVGTAFQGAAGAGLSSALAGKLNGVANEIGEATGSMTVGNSIANVLAGLGGVLIGGNVGAVTAANADLYNRSTGNSDGKGGTGEQVPRPSDRRDQEHRRGPAWGGESRAEQHHSCAGAKARSGS